MSLTIGSTTPNKESPALIARELPALSIMLETLGIEVPPTAIILSPIIMDGLELESFWGISSAPWSCVSLFNTDGSLI